MNKLLAALLLAVGTAASAQTVVYETFNEQDQQNLFDCCSTAPIVGHRADQAVASIAVPFSPAAYAKISQVDVALSSFGGSTGLRVSINGSTGGLPGIEKKLWHTSSGEANQCCQYVSVHSGGKTVHAAAGGRYWIVIEGTKRSVAGWNLNTLGLSGPYAVKGDDGVWTMTEGPLPALKIISR